VRVEILLSFKITRDKNNDMKWKVNNVKKINSEYSCVLILGISGGECFWALH